MATRPVTPTTRQVFAHRWRLLEQAMTAIGLVTAGVGLMCLLAFAAGWSPAAGFMEVWLVLAAAASPLGPWIYRVIRPLFWRRGFDDSRVTHQALEGRSSVTLTRTKA